jgi:hypothetical protein
MWNGTSPPDCASNQTTRSDGFARFICRTYPGNMSKIRLTFFCVARSNSKNTETAFWGLDGVLACAILSQESFFDEKVS